MKTIGFIGLGTMGAPMAANLVRKGFEVTVYNRTAGKSEELKELGADVSGSPVDVAKACSVIITMISNDQAIEDVYFGPHGILGELTPGKVLIDCSTISPALARRIASAAADRYCDFLDAPVTGSKPAAIDGTLVFMVGGDEEVMIQQRDILLAMGRDVIHMGPNGSGSTAKLAHNTIVGINAAALIEGMSIAAKGGIDADSFLRLVQSGGAASRMADMKGNKIIGHDFSVQFSLALMLKDLKLSSVLAGGLGVASPMLEAAKNAFQVGQAEGHGDRDLAALALVYEKWIGQRIGSGEWFNEEEAAITSAEPSEESSVLSAHGLSDTASGRDRRRSTRLAMDIPLMMSIYQYQQEGAFAGQTLEGFLRDLSDNGIQIASKSPLELDMFFVIYFKEDSDLPPMTARIIRIERHGEYFHYGCMLSALPPYQRIMLEEYIEKTLANQQA